MRRAAGLAMMMLAMPLGAAAQPGDLDRYQELVAGYRDGMIEPVRDIAGWNVERIRAVLASAGPAGQSKVGWQTRDYLAAAMLHTDASLGLLKAGTVPVARHHLDTTARLIDETIAVAPAFTRYAERWYETVEGYARAFHAEAWARDLRERAKARFKPTAAKERFERGWKAELAGARAGPQSRMAFTGAADGITREAIRWFASAARDYDEALRFDPALLDAALHLGRVRVLTNQASAAVAPLKQASLSAERRVSCLALLFLGAIAERAGDLAEAETLYRQAQSTLEWGQSAALALAQILSRTGREPEAREVLARHLARTRGRAADPLWTYLTAPGDQLADSLEQLRAETWR